ncbi:hypothetical protein LTR37_001886 [Vermiconidia calcicola]|uniref:Uncharacterized protein n=1 Tax=Vermiconidia calcicola TaxID=1690605 RepID=A0ACC3NVF6_9PEZI|nr:hypothetical protein LTR37_001886 [Vermiconidia calcicola]
MAQLLLKNGIALIHDESEQVQAVKTDILARGNLIAKIGSNISSPQAEVIDCTDKIISPGFIDTHHHVWQTQLKGRHADHTLVNYYPTGNFTAKLFTAEDTFWGQLGGCLEMIDCGTTSVADFAHINMSPEHNYKAIAATVAAGMRSVYGFSPNPRLSSTVPFTIDMNGLGGHSMPTFDELGKASPWGDGRVTLGLAYDGFPSTPKEYLDMLMAKVDEFGIKVIQTHVLWRPGKPSTPQKIDEHGFLDKRFLTSHSSMSKEDADLYRKRGVHYSSTPSTELQMAMGFPVAAFRDDLGVRDLGSLGVDCHTNNSAFIPGEARIGLQSARAARGEVAAEKGKTPVTVGYTVKEAFNLATIRGAHAMKMEDKTGSIAEGKFADLVIFDAISPSMVCAGVHDPVAAIILHSSPADVETVIIDGIIRKRDGRLVDVKLDESAKQLAGKESVSWKDVATNLIKNRERIQSETEKIDYEDAERKVMEAFYISADDLGDP